MLEAEKILKKKILKFSASTFISGPPPLISGGQHRLKVVPRACKERWLRIISVFFRLCYENEFKHGKRSPMSLLLGIILCSNFHGKNVLCVYLYFSHN